MGEKTWNIVKYAAVNRILICVQKNVSGIGTADNAQSVRERMIFERHMTGTVKIVWKPLTPSPKPLY